MPIFDKKTVLNSLNEMKTREEYARRSFKKKYDFKPDKPGSNIGTITDKSGKTYRIDMDKSKTMVHNTDMGPIPTARVTSADVNDKDSTIYLDKNFFKLKGSNKSERRDATLQHEIGHQNLHNINPDNKTVDTRNRDMSVYKGNVSNNHRAFWGSDISKDLDGISKAENHKNRKTENDAYGAAKKYFSKTTQDKNEKKERREGLEAAKKYTGQNAHANAFEYEADRFAANRTSDSAIKKGLRNSYRNTQKDFKNNKQIPEEARKYYNKTLDDDYTHRAKALKDETLRKSNVYKDKKKD